MPTAESLGLPTELPQVPDLAAQLQVPDLAGQLQVPDLSGLAPPAMPDLSALKLPEGVTLPQGLALPEGVTVPEFSDAAAAQQWLDALAKGVPPAPAA